MFYNDLCLKVRIDFAPTNFFIKLLFKNTDFLATQLEHFDASLVILFADITFFEPILSVCFLQLKQYVRMFYNDGNSFLTTYFKHFDFV